MTQLNWGAHNPVRIVAAPGLLARVAEFVPVTGPVLLVTTQGFVKRGVVDKVANALGSGRLRVYDEVTPNPELDALDNAAARLVGVDYGAIVALGGGSAIDAAKALSVAIPSGAERSLHQAFRASAKHDWSSHIPVVAIPTTSGTGSEVTPFATVWDTRFHKKYSVAGPRAFPQVALLDPELTLSLPAQETLYTALDAISHALESLWNKGRTPVSVAYAVHALTLAINALPRVLAEPGDLNARAHMQEASTLAGLAISQTRTAIAHSISYPLTSHYGVPHGLACSFTLPHIISLYLKQNPGSPFTVQMREVQSLLEGLDLFAHLTRYATAEQIGALKPEMFHPERAGNFEGTVEDLDALIQA
jgi:phosphonate metabolism-associated iron-containing alcohol dehydrogenase